MIKNQWYAIVSSRQVKNKSMLCIKRLGLDLILFRDETGKVFCISDRCSHRGASLSKGKILDSCHIQCHFHGLEFDGSGTCKFIPANGIGNQEDLQRFNINSYKVIEKNKIIYFWYGEGDPSTEELAFFYDKVDDSYVFSEFTDSWQTHYSRAIENQLDVVHLPFVHHNTIGRGNKTLVNGPKVLVDRKDELIITSANNEVDQGQTRKKSQDCQIRSTNLNFKFPNIWLNRITDKIKVLIFFAPVDDQETILYVRFYNKLTKFKFINKIIGQFGKLANFIIERQDKRVVETQLPKKSSLKSDENLIPGDKPIIEYRKIREDLKSSIDK